MSNGGVGGYTGPLFKQKVDYIMKMVMRVGGEGEDSVYGKAKTKGK